MHLCKIVNNKVWTKADEGTQSVLLHTSPRKNYGHPVCKSGLCPPSPRGEEKNLLANEMSLQILGGGQLCASNMPFYVKPMLRL